MSTLPAGFEKLIVPFACLFSKWVSQSVQVLLAGAVFAPGKRTVTSALRIMGLGQERHFQTYHRVLNRAVWSSLAASRILLRLPVRAFAPVGPLFAQPFCEGQRPALAVHDAAAHPLGRPVLGAAVPEHVVPLAALPRGPRKAAQEAHRLGAARRHATVITRLRLDAALYTPVPQRLPGQRGRMRLKGERLPALNKVLDHSATSWITLTIPFWCGEHGRTVEVASSTPVVPLCWVLIRNPLKQFETQRQWSDKAIARTMPCHAMPCHAMPCLLALYFLVTLAA